MEKKDNPSNKYRKIAFLSFWCLMCSSLKPEILQKIGFKDGEAIKKLYPIFCGELNPTSSFSEKFNNRDLLKDYNQIKNVPVSDWILIAEAMKNVFSENLEKKKSEILSKGFELSNILFSTLEKEIQQSKKFLQKKGI